MREVRCCDRCAAVIVVLQSLRKRRHFDSCERRCSHTGVDEPGVALATLVAAIATDARRSRRDPRPAHTHSHWTYRHEQFRTDSCFYPSPPRSGRSFGRCSRRPRRRDTEQRLNRRHRWGGPSPEPTAGRVRDCRPEQPAHQHLHRANRRYACRLRSRSTSPLCTILSLRPTRSRAPDARHHPGGHGGRQLLHVLQPGRAAELLCTRTTRL